MDLMKVSACGGAALRRGRSWLVSNSDTSLCNSLGLYLIRHLDTMLKGNIYNPGQLPDVAPPRRPPVAASSRVYLSLVPLPP